MSAKDRFVQDTLQKEGRKMIELQTAQIDKVLNVRTGNLLRSRTVRTGNGILTFTHPIYERYLDIPERTASGRKKKSRRIHNRYTFGTFQSIARRLMYGYTEEVKNLYKKMENEKNK